MNNKQANSAPENIRNYKRHVLLVEDNMVNQMLINKIISKLGITISLAENGQEAIDILEKQDFDLILMDLEMPIVCGLTATKEIRARRLSLVPIVALTAHDDPATRRLCKETKMNGYITKPITVEKMINLFDKFLTT